MRRLLNNQLSAVGLVLLGLTSCSAQQQTTQNAGGAGNVSGGTTSANGGNGSIGSAKSSAYGGTNADPATGLGGVAVGGVSTASGGKSASSGQDSTLVGAVTGGAKAIGGTSSTTSNTSTAGGASNTGGKSNPASGNSSGGTGNTKTSGVVAGGAASSSGGTDSTKPTSATGGAGQGGTPSTGGTSSNPGTSSAPSTCASAATLKDAATCTGRLLGTALSTKRLQDSSYTSNALEFNYVTPEDEMKWDATEPSRKNFTFTQGDQITDFAAQHGMKVKGHTLVWYSQLPAWVSSITNASDLRTAMQDHITNVMQHYKTRGVVAWDVVNEAFDDSSPPAYRNSVFYQVLGASYIDDAFKAARAADASAKLFYNDFGTDGLSAKANAVYDLVSGLKQRGVPIDGVGLQMHWRCVGSTLTAAEVISNMQRLIDLGLEVVISEMDVQLCKGGTLPEQQTRFHDIVAACLTLPRCTAITFWGITDKYSWLNSRTDLGCAGSETPRPLLWDDNYAKKPAYTGVMNALLGQ